VFGALGDLPASLCQIVTKGEDEQSVEHVERPKPTRVKLRIGEDRLDEHEQEEQHCQADDRPPHAPDDRGYEHQDRDDMEDEEAPRSMRFHTFAAQDTKACEKKLDRNGENKQPSKPDERLSPYIHR
jgi:hypothetical protein